jgi:F0F1-type ATP synthase membrane subunit c/vacuolar-type H+-ATPase subunit K
MRIHALESSDGLTYAQMGRFAAAADPSDPKGTSDEALAAKDESGKPISNGARNTWVTETALSTALNVSYMAEQIALFSVVVGIALLLSGIGFIILALAVLGGSARKPAAG